MTAVLATVVVALAGNLLVAPYSARGFETLSDHRNRLEANISELTVLQQTLQGQIELLTRSSDAVRMEARSLGYYGDDETVVRINNADRPPRTQSPGRIILGTPEHVDRRSVVRLIAAVTGVVVFLALLLSSPPPNQRSMSRPSR